VSEAVLGAKIDVPSVDGPATLTLPAGTVSGAKLRLKGRGLVVASGDTRGDQYVVIKIVPPKELTDEQRRLFEQLRLHERVNPREACAWAVGERR
jgi:DnaJ-class molecular chaperone